MVSLIKNFFKSFLTYLGLFQKKGTLIFLGLENAGKTTLLNYMVTGKVFQFPPTFQPYNKEVKVGKIIFNTFDVGGHQGARKIWKDHYPSADGIVFIIDSSDKNKFSEVKEEFIKVCNSKELENLPILIFGNKVDKDGYFTYAGTKYQYVPTQNRVIKAS